MTRAATAPAPTTLPLPAEATPSRMARRVDPWIVGATIGLLALGTVVVYSASAVRSYASTGSSTLFLMKHLFSVALGLAAMTAAIRIPTERWSKWAYTLLIISMLLLLAVFVPGVGRRVNGALRWISWGPLTFQPAEFAKLAIVVYLAHSLAKKREMVKSFSVGFVPHVAITGVVIGLVAIQPDFGTSVIIMATMGLMLFAAGARIGYLILGAVLAIPPAIYYISTKPHAWKRILAFINPEAYKSDIGYQIWESLVSFGSGGMVGAGLGQGRQKLYFLPEAHTDFVYAVIGEELGFVGAVVVVALFAILVARGIRLSMRASCRLTMYLSFGISAWIGMQALTNMLVVISLVPTKGLTLPLVSFGRSSLVMTMLAIGLLLRISAEERSRPQPKGATR